MAGSTNITYMIDFNHKEFKNIEEMFEKFSDALTKHLEPTIKSMTNSLEKVKNVSYTTMEYSKSQNTGYKVNSNGYYINKDIAMKMQTEHPRVYNKMLREMQEYADNLAKENKAYRERRSEERKRDQELKQDRINESKARRQFEMDKANGLYGGDQRFVKTGFYGMRGNAIRILERYGKRGESLGGIGGALVSSLNFKAGDPKSSISKLNSFINGSLFKGGLKAGTAANVVGGFATGLVMGTRAITKFSQATIKASEDIEVLTAQLGVVVGNTAQAGDLFAQIKKYALKSPFSVEQSTGATVLLKQSGVLQSDLMETLNMLGDLSMGDRDKFNRIANNYAQILAAGKANAKDLKEFANAGIPVFKEIAKYFNKQTTAEVRKLTEEGKVTSSVITQVFKNLTGEGGNFYGSTQKYANTYKGRRQNIEDEIKTQMGDLGNSNYFFGRTGKSINLFTKEKWSSFLDWFNADYASTVNKYRDAMKAGLGNDILDGYLYQAVIASPEANQKLVSDDEYKKMSKKEKKNAVSYEEAFKDVSDALGISIEKVRDAFYKALADKFTQSGSDYFERLFQNDRSFAFKLNSAKANYDDNSNLKKLEKEIQERADFEKLIKQYDDLTKNIIKMSNNIVYKFDFKDFDTMYETLSSGVVTSDEGISFKKEDLYSMGGKNTQNVLKNIDNLKRTFGDMREALVDGLSDIPNGEKFNDLSKWFYSLSDSINELVPYSEKSADNVITSVGMLRSVFEELNNSELKPEEKKFVEKFQSMVEKSFMTNYVVARKPEDLFEPFQRRIFRSAAKVDERYGEKESLAEIQRKATKNIGTALMNNLLKTYTLRDIQSKFAYKDGELNSNGAFDIDWQKTTENFAKEQMNIHMIVHQLGGDLSVAVENLDNYNKSVKSQIDVYTGLESNLTALEDDLAKTFPELDKYQQTALLNIGGVKNAYGMKAENLRMNDGVLQAQVATPEGAKWVDAIENGFKVERNELIDAINDQKKTLMLLNNNIQINSAVLGTIKNLRDSSNQRRISQRFRNSGYFEKNGFVADKDSEFYNTFINTFSDLYMKLMNIDLSDMPKNPQEYEEYARRKTGGRLNFQQLKDLRNLQFSADTFDDSKIVEIFEKILGKTTLDDIIRELKRNQNTFDDVPRWEQIFANLSGLPLSYIKNKGKGNTIADAFGQLQSRDVLAATMRGYASTGANMSMISNLGVKNGERYDWKQSQDNLTALMKNGKLSSGARSGLLSGLQSSRDSLITLATALLTTTDNQTDKNKSVTDVLQNYFVGSYLKGTIKDGDKERKIELEQRKDEATGLYNFFEKGTENLIDTLDENFAFEKENTTQVVDKLMLVNNSAIAMVSALDNLASNIESLQDEISTSRVGRFTGNVNFLKRNEGINSYLVGAGNQFLGTTANGTYLQAFTEAYGKVQENFINNILEIWEMTKDVDLEKGDLSEYNKENNTSYDISYIKNARLLKGYIDSHESVQTIVEVLKTLGFTEDEVAKVAKEMAAEKVYSDRENTYQGLISQIPALAQFDLDEKGNFIANTKRDSSSDRFWVRTLGLSGNKQDLIDSIFYGENGGDATITEKAREDAKKKLQKSLGIEIQEDLQDNVSDLMKNFSMNTFTDSLQHAGKGMREFVESITDGNEAWKDFGKSFVNSVKQMTANMGDLMATAGLRQLMLGNTTIGIGLLLAAGMSHLVSGFLDPQDDKETDRKIETLKALKSDLKELIAQAKADAIYYEKEVSHKKALTTNQSLTKVNDAIITPSGNVINTHPDDWLIATKTPQTLGNTKTSAPVVNLSIVNNSGQQLSIKKTQTSSNGEVNIEAIIEGVVGQGIADGKFDGALAAREVRNAGRNVYM